MSDTQDRQPAKVRAERDIRGIEMGVVGQKAEAETESPTPILMDEPNPVIRVVKEVWCKIAVNLLHT